MMRPLRLAAGVLGVAYAAEAIALGENHNILLERVSRSTLRHHLLYLYIFPPQLCYIAVKQFAMLSTCTVSCSANRAISCQIA